MSSIVNTQLPTDSSLSTLHSQINKGMEVLSYRKLIAYQKAKEVVKHTYQLFTL